MLNHFLLNVDLQLKLLNHACGDLWRFILLK